MKLCVHNLILKNTPKIDGINSSANKHKIFVMILIYLMLQHYFLSKISKEYNNSELT